MWLYLVYDDAIFFFVKSMCIFRILFQKPSSTASSKTYQRTKKWNIMGMEIHFHFHSLMWFGLLWIQVKKSLFYRNFFVVHFFLHGQSMNRFVYFVFGMFSYWPFFCSFFFYLFIYSTFRKKMSLNIYRQSFFSFSNYEDYFLGVCMCLYESVE